MCSMETKDLNKLNHSTSHEHTSGDIMVSFRAELNDYTNRVLGVVKEKYGLKNRSSALNLFAEMYGEDFVEPEIRDEFVEEVINRVEGHLKKYPKRKPMTMKELDELCGV